MMYVNINSGMSTSDLGNLHNFSELITTRLQYYQDLVIQ